LHQSERPPPGGLFYFRDSRRWVCPACSCPSRTARWSPPRRRKGIRSHSSAARPPAPEISPLRVLLRQRARVIAEERLSFRVAESHGAGNRHAALGVTLLAFVRPVFVLR